MAHRTRSTTLGPYVLTTAALFLGFAAGCNNALKSGQDAYEKADHSTALEHWQPLAEAGEGVTPRWVAARRLCWDTSRWGGRFATTAVAVEREGAEGQLVLGRRPRA